MEDDEVISNASAYSSRKFELTFRDIVLRHILKLSILACVEFRGGFWQQKNKLTKDGLAYSEKIYIPDSREEYNNAINFLHDILLPHFDEEMLKQSRNINKKLDDLRMKCVDATSIDETKLLGTEREDTVVLPIENYTGNDKMIIEAFRYGRLRYMRQLFQEISKFLKRWNYGAPEPITD